MPPAISCSRCSTCSAWASASGRSSTANAQAESSLDGVSYLAFLAPALIATTAMMTSATEALWPLLAGFKWTNQFLAMTATPLRPVDVVGGFALWVATRAFIGSAAVAAVLVLFDETRSWGLLPAIVFGVLTGLAFAMPVAVWTSTREREISFPAIMRFGLVPLFLFAGAFFPVDQLPAGHNRSPTSRRSTTASS